jgi:hypothetical protein
MIFNNEYNCNLLSNFIPIIVIFLFVHYPDWFIYYGNTVLGKLILLMIIIYYTFINWQKGLIVCIIVILFYQLLYSYNKRYLINESIKLNDISYKQEFKKNNCDNGVLKYKGTSIKKDIIPHIFPEINFTNNVCNPCDDNCDFNIIEEKEILNRDRELKTPKQSNDWIWTMWNNVKINENPLSTFV